jgi:S-adenosylmethionine/arginine decarboxylase-like enzyme
MLTLSKYQANGEIVILLHVQCQSLYVRLDVNTCGLEMLCATTTAIIRRATLTAATVQVIQRMMALPTKANKKSTTKFV